MNDPLKVTVSLFDLKYSCEQARQESISKHLLTCLFRLYSTKTENLATRLTSDVDHVCQLLRLAIDLFLDQQYTLNILLKKYRAKLTRLCTYVNLESFKSASAYITDFRTMQTNEQHSNLCCGT